MDKYLQLRHFILMHLARAYGLFCLIINGQFFFIGYYTCTFMFQTYDVTLTLLLQGKEVSFVLEAKIYGQLQVSAILSECESWILWSKFLMFSFDC